tara:strand:+ start:445 stop:633 length:189 start_codon:yes stop_codon:yes gene_type:complete
MINWIKNLHPARIGAFFEALIAGIASFLPLSGEQVASLMAIVAVATGEQVRRRVINQIETAE